VRGLCCACLGQISCLFQANPIALGSDQGALAWFRQIWATGVSRSSKLSLGAAAVNYKSLLGSFKDLAVPSNSISEELRLGASDSLNFGSRIIEVTNRIAGSFTANCKLGLAPCCSFAIIKARRISFVPFAMPIKANIEVRNHSPILLKN